MTTSTIVKIGLGVAAVAVAVYVAKRQGWLNASGSSRLRSVGRPTGSPTGGITYNQQGEGCRGKWINGGKQCVDGAGNPGLLV